MRVAKFFDGYAHDFNAIYGNAGGSLDRLVNSLFRRSMRLRFEKTIEGCHPIEGADVLDVGCGPGHYSVTLARKGALSVHGIDFAPGMIEIARQRASDSRVSDRCTFEVADFNELSQSRRYDYVVVMGFMDYVATPAPVVAKAIALSKRKAFFSFPCAGGFLAWQRHLRYRSRCELYMYREEDIARLFAGTKHSIERIARDFFVEAVGGIG